MTGRVLLRSCRVSLHRVPLRRARYRFGEEMTALVTLAILGIIVLPPCLADNADKARARALRTNVAAARRQIARYRANHGGRWPHVDAGGKLDADNFVARMTGRTDADGTVKASGEHGPYLSQWPENPFVPGVTARKIVFGRPDLPVHDGSGGWYFNTETGTLNPIFGNNSGRVTRLELSLITELQIGG